MTDTELLPCPFCRGKAHLSTVGRSWYRITADHVEGCILEEHESDCPQTDDQLPLLLRDWNTRSGFTAIDMGTAAADGRRSLAEHPVKQIAIEHPDQDTLLTVKYIAQWIALESGL